MSLRRATTVSQLATIKLLVTWILEDHPLVQKDERKQPELRDVRRIASGHKPLSNAGKAAWEQVHSA